MADGVTLFHANAQEPERPPMPWRPRPLGTAARKAFRVQKAPKGTILNLHPRYLIVPAALEQTADQLTSRSTWRPPQSYRRSCRPSCAHGADRRAPSGRGRERRRHQLVHGGRPVLIDTIEYCYLEGQQGVYIETRQGFEVDGVEIKARLDFAAAAIDYRGLQKNTAA